MSAVEILKQIGPNHITGWGQNSFADYFQSIVQSTQMSSKNKPTRVLALLTAIVCQRGGDEERSELILCKLNKHRFYSL